MLMLHVCIIFVWIVIKTQWLPLILNRKSSGKALASDFREISFSFIMHLFALEFIL